MWGWKPDGFSAAAPGPATRTALPAAVLRHTRPLLRLFPPLSCFARRDPDGLSPKKADNFFTDSFLKGSFSLFLQPLLGQIGLIPINIPP